MSFYAHIPLYYAPGVTYNGGFTNVKGPISHGVTLSGVFPKEGYSVTFQLDWFKPNYINFKETPDHYTLGHIYPLDRVRSNCSSVCLTSLASTYYNSITDLKLNQIYNDSLYIYGASSRGINVFDLSGTYLDVISIPETRCIWASDDYIYAGTVEGVFRSSIVDLYTNCPSFSCEELAASFSKYLVFPELTSNDVKYIHGESNRLLISTISGIDYYNATANPIIHSKHYFKESTVPITCFLSKSSAYYVTSSGNRYSVNRLDSCLCDWSVPSYVYSSDNVFLNEDLKVNDIFVTNNTASNNANTLMCATSSGVYLIDEGSLEYHVYLAG